MFTYSIKPAVRAEMYAQAVRGEPYEVCGFAFGGSYGLSVEFYSSIECPNGAKNPTRTFEIDGATFRHAYELAKRSRLILAIWHSHPDSQPTPSKEDFALISQLEVIPFMIVGVQQAVITIYESDECNRVREASRMKVGP